LWSLGVELRALVENSFSNVWLARIAGMKFGTLLHVVTLLKVFYSKSIKTQCYPCAQILCDNQGRTLPLELS
jgi:hypothetical protein